jgi:cell wall-associated NlpC family hydrolase
MRTLLWVKLAVPVLIAVLVVFAASGVMGVMNGATAANADQENSCGAPPAVASGEQVPVPGVANGLTPDQLDNARTVAGVALGLRTGRIGVRIAMVTVWTEATLRNVNYGDMMGPRQPDGSRGMSSSRGLFQQLTAWGPLQDRLDPATSTTMFFTGGQAGQKGLLAVPHWWTLDPWVAAQAVQQSEFSDGSNYRGNLATTDAIVTSILAGQPVPDLPDESVMGGQPPAGPGGTAPNGHPAAGPQCTPATPGALPNTVVPHGVDVTIPAGLDPAFVAPAVAGKTIKAPNAAMARGLAAGFSAVGLPYVWGGGGSGAGPNDGCSRGGGDFNSCQGLRGFDCTGLTAYVLGQAGHMGAPGSSGEQRASGQSVPYEQGLPGDIVGFPGHVAVYLGVIDGTPYILEASWVGTPIHIVPLTRTDRDGVLHRLWAATNA